MSFIDYVHVITKFLVPNDRSISKIRKNQGKKLHNLFLILESIRCIKTVLNFWFIFF